MPSLYRAFIRLPPGVEALHDLPESGDSPGLAYYCGSQTVGYILRLIGSQAGLEQNFERRRSNRFQGRRRLQLKRLDGHRAGETVGRSASV